MEKIEILGKYNLTENSWGEVNKDNRRDSLAISNYEPIINKEEETKYDYIIHCRGSRLEDHSKDGYHISDNAGHIDGIIEYFKNKDTNIIIKFVMLDNDAPLRENGRFLAYYINSLCKNINCNSINIIACSKAGVTFFNSIKYINSEYYKKINLYNVVTPYEGTMMASPELVYEAINNLMSRQFTRLFKNFGIQELTKLYESISSKSHMDYDIGLLDKNSSCNYDASLIRNLFMKENINAIKSINNFRNYTAGIDNTTLKRAISIRNGYGIGMCLINEYLMGRGSDGLVHTWSEESISKYMDVNTSHIKGAHHDIMSDSVYRNEILFDIYDNLLEQRNLKREKKRY